MGYPSLVTYLSLLGLVVQTAYSVAAPPYGVMTWDTGANNTEPSNQYRYNISSAGGTMPTPTNPAEIAKRLSVNVTFETPDRLDIRIINPEFEDLFEIPFEEPFPFNEVPVGELGPLNYNATINHNPFSIVVQRKSTWETIFNTSVGQLAYADQYLEFSTNLPTERIFGWGERAMNLELKPGTYVIWARDILAEIEDGSGNIHSTYGTHPMLLVKEKSGNFFVLFMRNSNAQEVTITKDKITWRATGGIIHIKLFMGDKNPETAIKMYHDYIGGWMYPPFWSIGYHQCRWGYVNLGNLETVVLQHRANDIPMDTMWMDIDYMREHQVFTIDESRYPLQKLTEFLQKTKVKFVPILDPGIGIKYRDAPSIKRGLDMDVFIKSPLGAGRDLLGSVWPGYVHFPDWFKKNAIDYWNEMIEGFSKVFHWDGLWLDMNEVANFCNGECDVSNPAYPRGIPYIPGKMSLDTKTIPISTKHVNGFTELNTHNLFGMMETYLTHKAMKEKLHMKYPFILSRSTFAGSGRYGFHWTGDNAANWDFLRLSVPGMMQFSLFGIPMTGADICGFYGNTEVELCNRWIQLGALYPFARNHNHEGFVGQELYAMGPTLLDTGRKSLRLRYSILKYYMSLYFRNRGRGTIFRPVFFEFPDDNRTYHESVVNFQFLLGSELMACPILFPNVTMIAPYFPQSSWYDFHTGDMIQSVRDKPRKRLVQNKFNASLPIFIRGGKIVPQQDVTSVASSNDLDNVFRLVVGLQQNLHVDRINPHLFYANGKIMGINQFNDDNIYQQCDVSNCMVDITATIDQNWNFDIEFMPEVTTYQMQPVLVNRLIVFGLKKVNFPFEVKGLIPITLISRDKAKKDQNSYIMVTRMKAVHAYQFHTHNFDMANIKKIRVRLPPPGQISSGLRLFGNIYASIFGFIALALLSTGLF